MGKGEEEGWVRWEGWGFTWLGEAGASSADVVVGVPGRVVDVG